MNGVRELTVEEIEIVSGGSGESKKTVVSSGVLNGKAISKPQPAYPAIA